MATARRRWTQASPEQWGTASMQTFLCKRAWTLWFVARETFMLAEEKTRWLYSLLKSKVEIREVTFRASPLSTSKETQKLGHVQQTRQAYYVHYLRWFINTQAECSYCVQVEHTLEYSKDGQSSTHAMKLSSTLMSICWQTELNLIQEVRPDSTLCSPGGASGLGKRRLAQAPFQGRALTPAEVSGTLQCVHSQCIPTGFYKTYKIIWEGIQFLEICYSVPFNGKKKKIKTNKQQMMIDQAPSQLGGTNTT